MVKVIPDIRSIQGLESESSVALGTFDGVHLGHRRLVALTVEMAKENGLVPVAFTFANHPLAVIGQGGGPPMITTGREKVDLLFGLGVEVVVDQVFDREFASLSPEAFARDILAGKMRARRVVVGFNYSFGARGAGTPDILARLGERLGFSVTVVPPVRVGAEVVSSSEIRRAIQDGDVEKAARLLGRPYSLSGPVVAGRGQGRTLGYPTANVQLASGICLPKDGVYAVKVRVGDAPGAGPQGGPILDGICNIGSNPTFSGKERTLEVHIFGLSESLYGRWLEVFFAVRLRGEIKFDTPYLLARQIHLDSMKAQEILKGFTTLLPYDTIAATAQPCSRSGDSSTPPLGKGDT